MNTATDAATELPAFFLDSCSIRDISYWRRASIIDGVTTNPILLSDAGMRLDQLWQVVHTADPLPCSVQITTVDPVEAYDEACRLAELAGNVVVKVPIVGPDGTPATALIGRLVAAGIPVNVTGCTNLSQLTAAAGVGARYTSLLYGRIRDLGLDARVVVEQACRILIRAGCDTRLILGSIRGPGDVNELLAVAGGTGPFILTVPPAVLSKTIGSPLSRSVIGEFYAAAKALRADAAADDRRPA